MESGELQITSYNRTTNGSPRPASGRWAEVERCLAFEDKWLATPIAAIHGEMDRMSQQLTSRVKELAERYDEPMPAMVARVIELESEVASHPDRMGFSWK